MIQKIIQATGIEEVAVSDKSKTASDYCEIAAKKLMEESGIVAGEIDGLIYAMEFPDYFIPNTASILQNRLNIPNSCITYEIHIGCAGFVYGLFQAYLMVESGYCDNILLLCGCPSTQYVHPEDRALRMVTGDAACAALIQRSNEVTKSGFSFYSDGGGAKSLILPAGGARIPIQPGVTDQITYDEEGNGRSQETIYMNGMDIMVFVLRAVPGIVNQVIEMSGWKKEEIDIFAFHQVNQMILKRLSKGLKIELEKIPVALKHIGNTGMVSIPVMLTSLYASDSKKLNKVIMSGFGAGLAAAACFLDLSQTRIYPLTDV